MKNNTINKSFLFIALIIGIVSSFVIGLYFKAIEFLFGIKVYTLLLNIDYFPILKKFEFHEVIEFSFHILVSIVIVGLLIIFKIKLNWSSRQTSITVILVSLIIGMLIYPTTALSTRTPNFISITAFSHWIIGHFLFGIAVALCFKLFIKEN